ncbi:unnamed protein product [Amaranthus hypochondriacus]
MGNPKLRWTPEEEKALREGVAKHGVGKWIIILKDPQFSHILRCRSNVNLKHKWKNINRATEKQKESLSTKEETALGALGEVKYGIGDSKSIQEDPEFNKCSDSCSDVELQEKWQNMKVEASMPQPAIQDQLNFEFEHTAARKRKMSEMQSELDANAQAETDAEEESEAKAETETQAEAKTEAGPSQSLLQKMPEAESDKEAEINAESETENKEQKTKQYLNASNIQ